MRVDSRLETGDLSFVPSRMSHTRVIAQRNPMNKSPLMTGDEVVVLGTLGSSTFAGSKGTIVKEWDAENVMVMVNMRMTNLPHPVYFKYTEIRSIHPKIVIGRLIQKFMDLEAKDIFSARECTPSGEPYGRVWRVLITHTNDSDFFLKNQEWRRHTNLEVDVVTGMVTVIE